MPLLSTTIPWAGYTKRQRISVDGSNKALIVIIVVTVRQLVTLAYPSAASFTRVRMIRIFHVARQTKPIKVIIIMIEYRLSGSCGYILLF